MNSRRSFEGARCLVTGAESDLGRALVGRLAREGGSVLLTGRSLDQLETTARALADCLSIGEFVAIDADLGEAEGRNKVIHAAASRFGALDLVIHPEDNPAGLVELTHALLPLLKLGASPTLVSVATSSNPDLPASARLSEFSRAEWDAHGIPILEAQARLPPPPTANRDRTTDRAATRILESIRRRAPDRPLGLAARLANLSGIPMSGQSMGVPSAPAHLCPKNARLPRPHFHFRMTWPSPKGD